MNGTEQVQYESRVRMRYAAISALAGVLLVASAVIQLSGPHTNVDELTLDLITAHKRFPLDLIGASIDCIGLLTLAAMLNWLNSITRARNPQVRQFIRWLAITGAVLSGVMAIAYAAAIAIKAHDFVASGLQTYPQANALTSGGLIEILPLLAQLGSLLLTAGVIWISLNALRVGLMSRFMGYLGVFAGALVLFPIGSPVPVVQGFWLVAAGLLFAGRWPTGMPPAWEAGVAIPWPPLGQPRTADGRSAPPRQRSGRSWRQPAPPPAPAPAVVAQESDQSAATGRTRASTPKRKRKRRN